MTAETEVCPATAPDHPSPHQCRLDLGHDGDVHVCYCGNGFHADVPALLAALVSEREENTRLRDTLHEDVMWSCRVCGPSPMSAANWCDRGCGRDYNEMKLVPIVWAPLVLPEGNPK